jgi:dTDP-4-amino-4,6-dideoxygalactose transaminase
MTDGAAQPPPITISAPFFDSDVEESVLSVLRSGHVAQGPVVRRFEEQCAAMAGTTHAVAVNSGTAALEAALSVLEIGPGHEVITSPFTFVATVNAILGSGAAVRFADIGEDFNVLPVSVEAMVGPRTRALLPVHLYGLMADMDALVTIAAAHSLAIVEDAAQAHGARQGARRAGGSGIGCFSFYATKNVTSAEGGMITTSDGALAERLRILRNQGMAERYQYVAVGRNLRLTDLAAALAVPQMERLAEITAARDRNAMALSEALGAAAAHVELPRVPAGRTHVWHQYTVLLPRGTDRDAVVRTMGSRGVAAGVYYPRLVWDHEPFRDHPQVHRDPTPVAQDVAARCLSLPVHQRLATGDVDRITAALVDGLAAGGA